MIIDGVLDCCHGIQRKGGRVAEPNAYRHEPWCRYHDDQREPRWPTIEEMQTVVRKVLERRPERGE